MTDIRTEFAAKNGELRVYFSPRQAERFDKAVGFDGFNDTLLDAQATVLDSTKRTAFDAETGNFVDVHRAASQRLDRLECAGEVRRDDAGTEAVSGGIRDRESVVEVAHGENRRKRPEAFADHHAAITRHVGDYGGLKQCPVTLATDQHFGARGHGFLDHGFQVNRRG